MSETRHIIIKSSHAIGIVITLVSVLAGVCFGYGILTQKVEATTEKVSELTEQIYTLNSTVQKLVGKVGISLNR